MKIKELVAELFDVELLFEIDGCKVYRFQDNCRNLYFATNGSAFWTETRTKTWQTNKQTTTQTTTQHSIPTVNVIDTNITPVRTNRD